MEGVKAFLDSSTIHGLNYISTTKQCGRLFWILTVIGGFSTAAYIIHQSFYSWIESPVTTTIETLSISEIKLPKVTVCPPKNTYTDLNYDLMMAESVVLTDEMRDELFNYALDVIWDENDIFGKLKEENRYFNWYNGFTEVKPLKYDPYYGLQYFIDTTAESGVVTTQYYGQQFDPDLVEKALKYKVSFHPPEMEVGNSTLRFKLEKVAITEVSSDRFDRFHMNGVTGSIDPDKSVVLANFSNLGNYPTSKIMYLWRFVGTKDLETMNMETMPGFRFSWSYTGNNVTSEPKYSKFRLNKMFIK